MNYRLQILALLVTFAWIPSLAQSELNISKLFDGQFRDDKNAVETIITGDPLYEYYLDYYHSLSFSKEPDKVALIEPLVTKDGAEAIDKEVSYRGGKLYYAFYTFPPLKKNGISKSNRYLFYLNQYAVGRDGVTLIYMSGEATRKQVKKMLKK
ncbi:MAG: DUF6108 family protein [Muribaculum sp.]|nr:DUF6108 family protein [Muribaculum sp.]